MPFALVAPTVMADGALPGDTMPATTARPSGVFPRLPAAVTTVMPAALARSTARHRGSSRHDWVTGWPSERLRTRMLYRARLAIAQSIASMTSLVRPTPRASITRRLIRCAPGATPFTPSGCRELPAMMPAMCVPWP